MLKSNSQDVYEISSQGLQSILKLKYNTSQDISRNVNWTDDFTVQLPIRINKSGLGSLPPKTLVQLFQHTVQTRGDSPALSKKVNQQWHTISFKQYYQKCMNFARSLIAFGVQEWTGVSIIGSNAPEWNFSFLGSIFAKCMPVGVYTTNNQTTCEYLAQHSKTKIVVAQNTTYAQKYLKLIESGKINYIVIYDDPNASFPQYGHKILQWKDFIDKGLKVQPAHVQQRMSKLRPGNCCTLIYTSGTTGMPKGVMLSHDNYVFMKRGMDSYLKRDLSKKITVVSFLPLSHVAGQYCDIVMPIIEGSHVYIANPDAIKGSLIQTLKEVKPTFFLAVPRIWEKIYDRILQSTKNNNWLKSRIQNWAKKHGAEDTHNQRLNESASLQFKLANKIVYKNVKKVVGLDNANELYLAAAPMQPQVKHYFKSLNIPLINAYGMSQTSGPQILSDPYYKLKSLQDYKQAGKTIQGTEVKIQKIQNNDIDGEICFRGRNVFMGYYRNPEETAKVFDKQGFLRSGDMGHMSKEGGVCITGRVKELIITAGGENIPPILIENQLKNAMPFLSNVIVVGDMKKYLTCLVTLKEDPPKSGLLQRVSKQYLSAKGCNLSVVSEARSSSKLHQILQKGLSKANEKAISKAQYVHKCHILNEDFSVDNGLLTPTLKLKRNVVLQRYAAEIQQMYIFPKL